MNKFLSSINFAKPSTQLMAGIVLALVVVFVYNILAGRKTALAPTP